MLEGKDPSISSSNHETMLITNPQLNPGRTELPDNLKALFRPVTMVSSISTPLPRPLCSDLSLTSPSLSSCLSLQVVPDLEQICEIMLFSEGFDSAKLLAKKMTVLYKLSREQLSKQHHYDFGLRALKSVLVMAGSLKRGAPEMSEQLVLMRALRDMNLPKVSSYHIVALKSFSGSF